MVSLRDDILIFRHRGERVLSSKLDPFGYAQDRVLSYAEENSLISFGLTLEGIGRKMSAQNEITTGEMIYG